MTDTRDKLNNAKDKIIGEVKEAVGRGTGNEELELKGKIQSFKADFKGKMDSGAGVEEIKEDIAGKINNIIDKKKNNK